MVLLKPFLSGATLFSGVLPEYESQLKEELYGCFKFIGIPLDVLYKMPVRDRKYFILRHNKYIEEENSKLNKSNRIDGSAINNFSQMDQSMQKALNR